MDALSLVANTIAVLSTGKAVFYTFEKLNDLHTAPFAAYAVYNEISDIGLVVKQATFTSRQYSNVSGSPQSALLAFNRSLERVKEVLLELETIIESQLLLQLNSNGEVSVKRFAWVYRKNRIIRLQKQLRKVNIDLTVQLAVLLMYAFDVHSLPLIF